MLNRHEAELFLIESVRNYSGRISGRIKNGLQGEPDTTVHPLIYFSGRVSGATSVITSGRGFLE
jgi:hypothetical protein